MANIIIDIKGMSCNHCKIAVEEELNKLEGVIKANVNLKNNNVEVEFDETKVNMEKLKQAIEEAGYEAV